MLHYPLISSPFFNEPKGNCGTSRSHEMVVQFSFQPFTLSNPWYRPNFAPVLITPRRPNKAFLRWLNMLNPSEPRDSWHETWKKIAWSTYTHVNLELHVVKNTRVTRRRMEKGFARASLWSKIQLRSSVRKRSCTSSRDWLLIRHRYVVIPKNQSHQRAEVEGETQHAAWTPS